MRHHRQNAAAQFLLEAVHHRQHDNQRRHAQGNAQHGDQRNEGNEVVAPLGARIAQADQQFVGQAIRGVGFFEKGVGKAAMLPQTRHVPAIEAAHRSNKSGARGAPEWRRQAALRRNFQHQRLAAKDQAESDPGSKVSAREENR